MLKNARSLLFRSGFSIFVAGETSCSCFMVVILSYQCSSPAVPGRFPVFSGAGGRAQQGGGASGGTLRRRVGLLVPSRPSPVRSFVSCPGASASSSPYLVNQRQNLLYVLPRFWNMGLNSLRQRCL